jgi:hypothetical protein
MRHINKQKYIFGLGAYLYLLTISFSMHILLEIMPHIYIPDLNKSGASGMEVK